MMHIPNYDSFFMFPSYLSLPRFFFSTFTSRKQALVRVIRKDPQFLA